MDRIRSFPPVARADARLLIVGSMPGEASLVAGRYYAHPRNQFWPIMAALLGFDHETPYPARLQALQAAGIALWDVLESCVRRGSLDTAIGDPRANDFARFLAAHPRILHVGCNGSLAAQSWRRHVQPCLPDGRIASLTRLPSTSPAHAGRSRDEKLQAWRDWLQACRPASP